MIGEHAQSSPVDTDFQTSCGDLKKKRNKNSLGKAKDVLGVLHFVVAFNSMLVYSQTKGIVQ